MEKEAIESIVRNVLNNLGEVDSEEEVVQQVEENLVSGDIDADKDYPLATKRPELIKTPTNRNLEDITLDKVMNGEISDQDVRITSETLKHQAEIARQRKREQFAKNLERAAELTKISDERILEIYGALRPNRSTKEELLAIADELESKYNAVINAKLVREAAEVYEKRGRLRD